MFGTHALIGVLSLAAFWDLKWRKIPNWLTVTLFGVGLLSALVPGWHVDFLGALKSASIMFALTVVPFALRILKGGDVKLTVAASAWLTTTESVVAFLVGLIFGGVIALLMTAADRHQRRSILARLYLVISERRWLAPAESDHETTVPMGVAFALSYSFAAVKGFT